MRWSPPLPPRLGEMLKALRGGGLGIAAMAYVGVDYLRYLSPSLHERLQPALWTVLALVAVSRVPFYEHWSAELRSALPFVAAMLFMLSALLFEALSVRFVTAVLGLDWHRELQLYFDKITELVLSRSDSAIYKEALVSLATDSGLHPLVPYFIYFIADEVSRGLNDFHVLFSLMRLVGSLLQNPHINVEPYWLLLALNEKLPQTVVEMLRAHIIGLHHFLMLFVMLAFSVLFDSVRAPGLGLGARYMFTMAIGRLLRAISFVSTILPSARPWCASARFTVPTYPHPWAQKYYVPYASDAAAIRQLIHHDIAYDRVADIIADNRPDWGSMSFLIDFLRPTASEGASWYNLLKKAGGGCNDLLYSGHMLVAVLTAMAWTEAYGGFSSVLIWLLVLHSAQREIRERHHYSVDCVVAIYVGILLWKLTGFIWPTKNVSRDRRLDKLEKIQNRLIQAAKDSDMDEVRELLREVELGSTQDNQQHKGRAMWLFSAATIFSTLTIVLLAFTWTSDG